MAPPIKTSSMVNRERRIVVLKRFIMINTSDVLYFAGGNKKDLYPRHIAWIKVLLADFCPGPGSFDRIDGIRVGLVCGR
jgi:hypothetical protein